MAQTVSCRHICGSSGSIPGQSEWNLCCKNDSGTGFLSIPATARSEALVSDSWLIAIKGSNPAGGMDICCECCVF
jgi:hypothetical protein